MEAPIFVLKNPHLENVECKKLLTPLKIPASPMMKSLGYGTCVNVYKLERTPRQGNVLSPWAVKRVSKSKRNEVKTEVFNERIQKEASILRQLQHPNIVGFRGLIKSSDGLETLVLECCTTSLGSILEERFENDFGPLSPENTLKIIKDVASALNYLHTKANILHGDLKSFNILVKENFGICKICDFGVSLPLDENGTVDLKNNPELRYIGTNLWSAPEIIDEHDIIDSKADIFSFGLTIYETIALVPPHTIDTITHAINAEDFFETRNTSLDGRIEEIEFPYGTRPPLPEAFELSEEYNKIVEIFYCCTSQLSEDRPTAKLILESI